jgi:hypothetical protein
MSGGDNQTGTADGAATGSILSDLRASGDGPAEGPDLGSLAARPTKRVSLQTIIIAMVLVASGGALYLMRKQGMNSGMHFDGTVKIDTDLAKVKPIAHTPAQQRMLEELAQIQDRLPAPAEKIQKNPFRLDARVTPDGNPAPSIIDNTSAIHAALASLTLNGIMQGPVPLARINGETVRVGDVVEKWFVVGQIHDRSVDLIAEGSTYTLSMGESVPAGGRRPRP